MMQRAWPKIAIILMVSTSSTYTFAANDNRESEKTSRTKEVRTPTSQTSSNTQTFDKDYEGGVDSYEIDLAHLKALISEDGEPNG